MSYKHCCCLLTVRLVLFEYLKYYYDFSIFNINVYHFFFFFTIVLYFSVAQISFEKAFWNNENIENSNVFPAFKLNHMFLIIFLRIHRFCHFTRKFRFQFQNQREVLRNFKQISGDDLKKIQYSLLIRYFNRSIFIKCNINRYSLISIRTRIPWM